MTTRDPAGTITATAAHAECGGDTPHHDMLHDFIAFWDEELHHEDATAAVGGNLVAYKSSLQQTHTQSQADAPNLEGLYSSSESSSDPVATTTDSTQPPPAATGKRKRQIYEIRQLREDAKALEQRHRELYANLLTQITTSDHDGSRAVTMRGSRPAWDAIATCELELLRAAELKNHALRAECQRQHKFATPIQRLLMKASVTLANTQRHFGSRLGLLQQRLDFVPNPPRVLSESHSDFQRLLEQIEPMRQEFAHIQRLMKAREQLHYQQATAPHSHTFRDLQVREDPMTGLFVDLVDSYEVPFSRDEVNAALRLFYGEHQGLSKVQSKNICEYSLTRGDTFIRQSVPVFTGIGHRSKPAFRLKEVVRNFSDDTQSVFLAVALVQPMDPAANEPLQTKTMTFRECKWTVVKRDGPISCIVQTYHQVTRESVESSYNGLWTREIVTGEMVPMWLAILSSFQSHVEAILLEQSILKRNGFNNPRRLGSD